MASDQFGLARFIDPENLGRHQKELTWSKNIPSSGYKKHDDGECHIGTSQPSSRLPAFDRRVNKARGIFRIYSVYLDEIKQNHAAP